MSPRSGPRRPPASTGSLKRIGADHIVYPERSAGERVAHTVAGHMIDYFEFEDGFAMARTLAPSFAWGRSPPSRRSALATTSRSSASSGPGRTSSTPCPRPSSLRATN